MENDKVIRSAMVVGAFTSLRRVLGMVSDLLTAGIFGTSLAMSAFVVAFRIPNLFRRLFGEGALSSAFIPVFMESRKKEGDDSAWTLASRVLSLAGVGLLGVPRFAWDQIPLSEEFADTSGIELEVGPLGRPVHWFLNAAIRQILSLLPIAPGL